MFFQFLKEKNVFDKNRIFLKFFSCLACDFLFFGTFFGHLAVSFRKMLKCNLRCKNDFFKKIWKVKTPKNGYFCPSYQAYLFWLLISPHSKGSKPRFLVKKNPPPGTKGGGLLCDLWYTLILLNAVQLY